MTAALRRDKMSVMMPMFTGPLRALAAPKTFWFFLFSYIVFVFALRVLVLPTASQDDAQQLIFAQTLSVGYDPNQPPLYTWLIWASTQVFGVTVLAVAVVKFACLGLLFAFLYLTSREVFGDRMEGRTLAALAGLSPLALFYVGFDWSFSYSNSAALAAACAATLYALLRLEKTNTTPAYLGFGLCVGLGLMSKYNYTVFIAALAIAGLCEPAFRVRLLNLRLLLAVAVVVVVCLLYLIWLVDGGVDLAAAFQSRLVGVDKSSDLARAGMGMVKLGNAVLSFLFPAVIIWLALFAGAWRRLSAVPPALAIHKRLFEVSFVATIVIMAAGILIFGITRIRNYYMLILLAAPIYFFIRVNAAAMGDAPLRRYVAALTVVTVVFLTIGYARFPWSPQFSKNAYFNVPYTPLAQQIRAGGFTGGTIIIDFRRYQIGGNLRIKFPDSRVISTKFPYYVPPPRQPGGQCLLIWNAAEHMALPENLRAYAQQKFGVEPGANDRTRVVEAFFLHSNTRRFKLGILLVTGKPGRCR